jgi:hypothetical protein
MRAQENRKYEKPDYPEIERLTKDKGLPSFYPRLFSRYEKNDTTLTASDFKLLYYGYFFQGRYNSYGNNSDFNDSIKTIYKKEKLTNEDRNELIRFTKELLRSDPFNLNSLNRLYVSYMDMGDMATSNLYKFKLVGLAKTLFATGDGRSDTTGIHVLSIDDEYSILAILGYEFDGSQTLTENKCDFLKVKHNDEGIDGMYFDVKQLFKGYDKMFKEEDIIEENKKDKK